MALLDILRIPDPRLRKKALPVDTVDRDVRVLMDNLLETLYDVNGVGLAAPQAGIGKRVIVVEVLSDPGAAIVMECPGPTLTGSIISRAFSSLTCRSLIRLIFSVAYPYVSSYVFQILIASRLRMANRASPSNGRYSLGAIFSHLEIFFQTE